MVHNQVQTQDHRIESQGQEEKIKWKFLLFYKII